MVKVTIEHEGKTQVFEGETFVGCIANQKEDSEYRRRYCLVSEGGLDDVVDTCTQLTANLINTVFPNHMEKFDALSEAYERLGEELKTYVDKDIDSIVKDIRDFIIETYGGTTNG